MAFTAKILTTFVYDDAEVATIVAAAQATDIENLRGEIETGLVQDIETGLNLFSPNAQAGNIDYTVTVIN